MKIPTELKQLCELYHLRPSKRYGQNYLVRERPIEDMIAAADISAVESVIEIGPGFGVLTDALVEQAKVVHAIEIEKKLQPYWEKTIEEREIQNLFLHWGNALDIFESIIKDLDAYSIVANLPYQITSPLLRLFLEAIKTPKKIVVMVQKEVAERICSLPGDMNLLALSVQYYGDVRIVSTVNRESFYPAPSVDSAIIAIENITPQKERDTDFDKKLFMLARAGFGQKRKQLAKNVTRVVDRERSEIDAIVKSVTGSATIRAEMLSIEQWMELTKQL